MKKLFLAVLVLSTAPAAAQDLPPLTGLDFMVDWPNYEGRQVVVTGGVVFGASNSGALLKVPGGSVGLRPKWVDREDLRYLFEHCNGLMTGEECRMTVGGTVRRAQFEDEPQLYDVDFDIPR